MKSHTLNPNKTLAILIGISKYTDFDDIAPAPNNVTAFAEILADKNIFGLPKRNIKIIIEGIKEKEERKTNQLAQSQARTNKESSSIQNNR